MHTRAAQIEVVIFDNDGLFVDTQSLWKRAQQRLFARHALEYGPAEEQALLGLSRENMNAALGTFFHLPVEKSHGLYDDLQDLVFEELATGCEPMPGAPTLVERLRAVPLPLGLASNSSRAFVEATLDAVNGRSLFDVIVTGDDVAHPKPAPDVYVVPVSS